MIRMVEFFLLLPFLLALGAIDWMIAGVSRPAKGASKIQAYAMEGATKVYKGQLVAVNGQGYLERAADALNLLFVGVAYEDCDNFGGGDAAKWCRVNRAGVFKFKSFAAISQVRLGERAYAADDNQVNIYSGDSHLCWVGVIVELDPEGVGTYAWVDIESACQQGCQNGKWVDPGTEPS